MTAPITISGTILRDAQMRRTRDGAAILSFDVSPPNVQATATATRSATVRIVKDYGTGESAAYAANARAQRLRRGVRVVVDGMGLHTARGTWVLQQVSKIDEPDLVVRNVTGDHS